MMRVLFINTFFLAVVLFYSGELRSQEYPFHTITNEIITAKIYLPDGENGFYRSSRFDWSGIIYELKYKGIDYFGQWYAQHNPEVNDAICGPVEEFEEIGYEQANENGEFLKIGVGGLRKPQENRYNKFKFYEVSNPGQWTINRSNHKIEFIHTVKNVSGYSYRYTKCIELANGKPELSITHTLENTGTKLLKTNVFNHNFFTIGHLPTGPDVVVKFPENIVENIRDRSGLLVIEDNKIGFKQQVGVSKSAMLMNVLGKPVMGGNIVIENQRVKAGVSISSDTEYSTIHFWASEKTYCPEPYINIEVLPQKKMSWNYKYTFYTE